MWLHIDSEDYTLAKTGVAVSENPAGPFEYVGSKRPNDVDSRDMTLFKDDDGTAYLIHSSDWNKTLIISRLTDDYTDLNGEFTKAFIDQSREARRCLNMREVLLAILGLYGVVSQCGSRCRVGSNDGTVGAKG